MWGTIFVLGLTGFIAYKIMESGSPSSGRYHGSSGYDDYEPDYDYDYDYEPDYDDSESSSYSGYCSHHGGIDDVCDSGAVICNDGSISPSS